ncbi:hypothetical protein PUN28_010670 [Cardiocondyla obscurior]|uniref:HMG box domain-containing protein n=1 Tax=Cardiocondyla obscurior TaxID=286306 RepID=A0AAW2FHE3_9HYME
MFSCGRHFVFFAQSYQIIKGVTEETDKKTGKQTQQDDTEKARLERCRRRAERKSACRCGEGTMKRKSSRSERKRQKVLSQNPFIIFFLEMYYKTPEKRVTEVAREAGKAWCSLPPEERMKYIRLAEKERTKRGRGRQRTRRRHKRD